MYKIEALLICGLMGFSFLIGLILPRFIKNEYKEKLENFSIGLAFCVIFGMILFHIIPDISESIVEFTMSKRWTIIIVCSFAGFLLLALMDKFIPHHHHDHKEKKDNLHEHDGHLYHISLITTLSLIIHNIIESSSVYTTGIYNIQAAVMMSLGICLHNLPLGIGIGSGLERKQKKKNFIIGLILFGSCIIGPLMISIIKVELSDVFTVCLICFTFGMLLYISLIELLKEIYLKLKNKNVGFIILGLLIGIIINVLMINFH